MKVFLSWSGTHSHAVAQIFSDWLPTVIQSVKPWLSSEHIAKGATWLEEVRKALNESNGVGLFFITREAIRSEWLLFEAGGIAALDKRRVCTVCIDLPPSELSPPLNFFQATQLEKVDVLKLVKDLNAQSAEPLAEPVLLKSFDRAWPDLETALQEAAAQATPEKHAPAKPPSATVAHFDQMMEALRRVELRIGRIEENQGRFQTALGGAVSSGRFGLPTSFREDGERDSPERVARVHDYLVANGIDPGVVKNLSERDIAFVLDRFIDRAGSGLRPRNALSDLNVDHFLPKPDLLQERSNRSVQAPISKAKKR